MAAIGQLLTTHNSGDQLVSNDIQGNTAEFTQLNPSVQTGQVANITSISASCSYIIKPESGIVITSHGICINKAPNPTISNTKFSADKTLGPKFNAQLIKLTPNVKYYVRSFITISTGTIYGNEVSFTTLPVK